MSIVIEQQNQQDKVAAYHSPQETSTAQASRALTRHGLQLPRMQILEQTHTGHAQANGDKSSISVPLSKSSKAEHSFHGAKPKLMNVEMIQQ